MTELSEWLQAIYISGGPLAGWRPFQGGVTDSFLSPGEVIPYHSLVKSCFVIERSPGAPVSTGRLSANMPSCRSHFKRQIRPSTRYTEQ